MKIIENGIWNDNVQLYELGTIGTHFLDGLYFITNVGASGGYRTVAKVDLTPYNKITYCGKASRNDGYGCYALIANKNNVDDEIQKQFYTTEETTISFDISGLSGEYYVGMNTYGATGYTKSIILE